MSTNNSGRALVMIDEIQSLLDKYLLWLKDKTKIRQINDWIEITTPYLDRHNDYLQIYVKRENNKFKLTDDGYIIEDLEQSGCKLDTSKRHELLKITLNGFGVQLDNGNLITYASSNNFALQKHNLVQAMLAINDLFYLAVPIVNRLFLEDVIAWLDLNEIRYIQSVKLAGESGYDHVFDFAIPKSKKQPERIIKAINIPSRNTTESFVWAWIDTKKVRPIESRAYAILNDNEHNLRGSVLDALLSYDIQAIAWSKREQFREQLAM